MMASPGKSRHAWVVPLALAGLAMTWPVGVTTTAQAAEEWAQTTVDQAEALTDQLVRTARQWWGGESVAPAAMPQSPPVCSFTAPTAMAPAAWRLTTRLPSALSPAQHRIDLPPPFDC